MIIFPERLGGFDFINLATFCRNLFGPWKVVDGT